MFAVLILIWLEIFYSNWAFLALQVLIKKKELMKYVPCFINYYLLSVTNVMYIVCIKLLQKIKKLLTIKQYGKYMLFILRLSMLTLSFDTSCIFLYISVSSFL